MVSDWRALNEMTVRDSTTLPNMYEMLDSLREASIFSKMDLNGGFNQIRVKDEDAHKTAIRTPLGNYEFLVMPMGLTNAPATFQRMMNRVLGPLIGKCVIVYLDDILVYSSSPAEHLQHLDEVLRLLRLEKLYAKPKKCLIAASEVSFLGHTVGKGKLSMDASKVEAVLTMQAPTDVRSMRRFLGCTNYFRRFIADYANISAPLHALTHKKVEFIWTPSCHEAFTALKRALSVAPVLRLPDFAAPFIVSTDASLLAVGAVLLQENANGERHAVAYRSHALDPTQQNWPTHDRELFAIVDAVVDWRYYLEGRRKFLVETDHRPLLHIMKQRELSPKQLRWITKLADFNFDITYTPGSEQVVADCLSRPELGGAGQVTSSVAQFYNWRASCVEAYDRDYFFKDLNLSAPNTKFVKREGLLYLEEEGAAPRLCIPTAKLRLQLLEELHDVPYAAHPGRDKMLHVLTASYFWPRMSRDIAEFVASCDRCQRCKPRTQKLAGLHKPLEVPAGPWLSVSMDFMTDLPRTRRGRDAMMVVVDRFSKMAHFTACHKDDTASDVAELYIRDVFRLHGLPQEIVSDRDPKFTSELWKELWKQLNTKLSMSTASHPQSDGQTERVNRVINEMVRKLLTDYGPDWEALLPHIEFAYNNGLQASIGTTPFYAVYAQHPRTPVNILGREGNSLPAANLISRHREIQHAIHDAIIVAQQRQAKNVNEHRVDIKYSVGDELFVSADRVHGGPPMATEKAKWQDLWRGPYVVTKCVGSHAYELAMPEWFTGHNVFNITHLSKAGGTTRRTDDSDDRPDEQFENSELIPAEPELLPKTVAPKTSAVRRSAREHAPYSRHDDDVSPPAQDKVGRDVVARKPSKLQKEQFSDEILEL